MYIVVSMIRSSSKFIKSCSARWKEVIRPHSYKQRRLTHRAVLRLVKRDDPLIVEIGAADGLDTAQFLKVFQDPAFRIIAIEPDPRNIAKFKTDISDPRVTLVEAGVSDTNALATFYLSSTEYSSSLKVPNVTEIQKLWPNISFEETITITTRTLDSIVEEMQLSHIDFIWADVQGAEDLVISGGRQALQRTRYLYTEYGGEGLYFDDVSLNEILSLLGSSWSLLYDYKTDALFENHNLVAKTS